MTYADPDRPPAHLKTHVLIDVSRDLSDVYILYKFILTKHRQLARIIEVGLSWQPE